MSTNKPIVCFDAMELNDFETCDFKWHAFHHLNLRPKATKSYFEKGIFLHYLLELYYKEIFINQTLSNDKLEQIVELGRIKSLEYDITLEEVSETFFQFREYIRFYGGDSGADDNIIPLHIEEPFIVEFFEDDDIKILLSGKPDIVFKYRGTNNIGVMDHKRVARKIEYSILRNQFQLYATAMKTDTVLVNCIGFQKTLKPRERFLRHAFVYSPEILEEWKQDVINRARQMVMCQTYELYQRRRINCKDCYLEHYCATRPKAREFLIGSEYLVGNTWDVSLNLERNY